MTGTCIPADPDSLAEQMGDLPRASDQLRLVGLDHASRVQGARLGATSRRLALVQARRPDDNAAIAGLENRVAVETQALRSFQLAAQAAEIEVPARIAGTAVIHGRVFAEDGTPSTDVTVAAIDATGRSQRYACTDAKGYFRLNLPVTPDRSSAVFLQVSGPDQAVLYRDSEAAPLVDQGVTYRQIQLGAAGKPPCKEPPQRATMPDLLGQPETVAIATLGRLGLTLGQRLTQRDPERAGLVLSQEPAAGSPIDGKTSVTLVIGVAEAADTVTVPDVVGASRDEAAATLKKAGLEVGAVSTVPGDKPGTILKQDPAAGIAVAPGTAIALVVAVEKPDERIAVPQLVGTTLEEAERLLKQAGLARGRIELRDDRRVGIVLAQLPQAGSPAEKGSSVDLVVGRKAEVARAQVPDLRGTTLTEARAALDKAQLTLGEVSGPQNGRVIEQKPGPGTTVAAGAAVAIALARAAVGGATTASVSTRLASAMAADRDFATLGIDTKALATLLAKAKVETAKAAQALADMVETELQKHLELQNRKQARDFRRMLKAGLERL